MGKKLFDYVIGNPPYQEEKTGDNKGFATPVYYNFMEEAYKVADIVELVTPARFLFNAGSTPKEWNQKMLSDCHLKVVDYHADCKEVFPNQDIKGGVAVTLRDESRDFGAIGAFTAFPELNSILNKAKPENDNCLTSVIFTQNRFNLDALYSDHPEYMNVIGSNGKDRRFRNNIFDKIPEFTEEKRNDDDIAVYGLIKNKRVWRYIPRKYFDFDHENFDKWKVLVPRANGSGAIGEVLSTPLVGTPLVGTPLVGYTQTFIGVGAFDTEFEANAMFKYIKSKFARTMLGILKITQDNDKEVWRFVPLQNFTKNSDIDWSKSVAEIDRQLYKKYGLTPEEIDFIETHIKEMA